MQNYLYIYSTVHREYWKRYVLTVFLTPLYIALGSLGIYLLHSLLAEKHELLFYTISIFAFPLLFISLLIKVNHKVVLEYKKAQHKTKYGALFVVGNVLSYILSASYIFALAALSNILLR